MTINGLLRQQQRLANIMDSPALRLRRRINGLLRQQQRLADIMDPPALRLVRELQERNKLFQAHENILAQFRPNDTLAELSCNFNKTQQSIMDNVRKAAQPLALPVAMNQRLKSVGTELVAQTTAAAGIVEATQRSRDIVASVSSLHRQHQSIIQDHFRRTDLLRQSFRSHFLPFHNALTESATAAAGIIEATQRSRDIVASVSSLHRQHQSIIQDHFRRVELLQKSLRSDFLPLCNILTNSVAEMIRVAEAARIIPVSSLQRQFQRAMAEPLRQTEQLRKVLRLNFLPATALSSQLHDILQVKTSLAVLNPTFTGEMPAWLHDGEATTSEPEREEYLAYLFGWLVEKFYQLPQGIISLDRLLTISFFLYSVWSGSQMEKRLTEQLIAPHSEKQIVREIEEIRPNPAYRKRYVVAVTGRLRLRSEPSLKAPILASLLPNTLVEEIEQHESWSLVEFFDYKDRSVKKGWVYRDYLRAIQPEKG